MQGQGMVRVGLVRDAGGGHRRDIPEALDREVHRHQPFQITPDDHGPAVGSTGFARKNTLRIVAEILGELLIDPQPFGQPVVG
jgi:hypothetical protein